MPKFTVTKKKDSKITRTTANKLDTPGKNEAAL